MQVRILYRVRQFWRTVFVKNDKQALAQARDRLTPGQWVLFTQMQPAEQGHALRMFRLLIDQGENQPDLLVAALLHDVGKLRYQLNPFERAVVVVIKTLLPEMACRWGELPEVGWDGLPGLRKAFILARQHPAWGAELARKAGVSVMAEELIRQHQQSPARGSDDWKSSLHYKLWAVDNDF